MLSSLADASSPHNSNDYSPNASNTLVDQSGSVDFPSPMSESALNTAVDHKRVHRRTLLLLTRSRGVQTDAPESSGKNDTRPAPNADLSIASTDTSPAKPIDQSETSSIHNRSGTFLAVLDHISKILTKLRNADISNLNKRLKKQHLPGDVGHLSRSTLRNLQLEVADLRNHFRGAVDVGVVSRREITLLLKLFKEVFSELVDLQAIVNDVTVEPSLAKKLQKDAYRDEEEVEQKATKHASGLGWIAAPITKFFVTAAGEAVDSGHNSSPRPGRSLEKSRLQPMTVRTGPKQLALTSATTTHISVEFGGSGMVRRALPAAPQAAQPVTEGLLPSLNGVGDDIKTQQIIGTGSKSSGADGLAPPTLRTPNTLRPSRSRANRNELLGIFAGAARPVTPTGGGPWQVVGNGDPPGVGAGKTIRAASSQYFADKTIRQRDIANQRKQLSAVVDAVIDRTAEQIEREEVASFQPALLERTLRPRGLSDSSIRSTFVSQANPGERLLTATSVAVGPAPRAVGFGSSIGADKRGVLESLANRFYTFRGLPTDISPVNPDASSLDRATSPPPIEVTGRSPARPIPESSLSTSREGAISPATVFHPKQGCSGFWQIH